MKKKIKLRNLTKEQWDENKGIECNKHKCCNNCKFRYINCDISDCETSWINHKEMYSDKFLNQEIEIEVPDILDEQKTKITLPEFWKSKEKLAIHCDTEEKANKLLKAFDKLGKKWCDEDSYIGNNYWYDKRENTCYSNDNGYTSINWYKENDYKIYEFEDVDFGKLEK